MGHLNVEFKARCENPSRIRGILRKYGADFKGEDHQIDTYFNVSNGRLKIREGSLENALIYYERSNQASPKQSFVILLDIQPGSELKEILTRVLGVKVVVDKRREIYFVSNVKFHIDIVSGLGSFLEVEAVDKNGLIGKDKLSQYCAHFMHEFGIKESQLIDCSYSDLLYGK